MSVTISEEIKKAFADPSSIKVLASISKEGKVHVVAKGSLSLTEEGQIRYLELLESSVTNRNLIYSLWYEKEVAVNIITKDLKSYQLRGIPVRTIVSGSEYESYYIKAQERNPENDLAAVYFIDITEVKEESYPVRKKEEEEKHPLYIHIDRLAKDED